MKKINLRISELRHKKKITQQELADVVGVSFQTISKWENGSVMPDITYLPMLAEYFEVSVDQLIGIVPLSEETYSARASSPCEILKSNRIMDVNEDVIINGFSDILKEAYNGVLTLDEYVQFIMNSFWARKYDFTFPEEINWLKIQGGVDKCIKKLTETLPEGQQIHVVIGDDNKENFTVDEWKTYEVIKNFKDGNRLMFIRNRKLYIEQMSKDSSSAFLLTQNKRFNGFDV